MLKPNTFALTVLLALLTGLGPLSTDMYLPSLPAIGRAFAVAPALVQMTLSAFLFGFSAGQIIYGPLADRYGRKPVLMAGIAIYLVATAACWAAWSMDSLIVGRFFQAFGASGPIVLARTIVRDLYQGQRAGQELARMGTIMGLVPAVAPVIGSLFETSFGWRSTFAVVFFTGLVGAVMVQWGLPETIRERDPRPITPMGILRGFAHIGRDGRFRIHTAIACAAYGGLFSYISASSFVLQTVYGLTPLLFGLAFGSCALAFITGTVVGQRVVRRLGMTRAIGVGCLLLAAGGLAMLGGIGFGPGHPLEIIVPMMIYLIGIGIVMPNTMASALMPFPDHAGAASSLIGFLQMTFGAAVGMAVGFGLGGTAWPLGIALAALGLIALTLFFTAGPTRTAFSRRRQTGS